MLPARFYRANFQRIDAEDGRQDLIDHITDVIRYRGDQRRRFFHRLEKLPFISLVEVVYRYYKRGKVGLPEGWVDVPSDVAEQEYAEGPASDVRNIRTRYTLTLRHRNGIIKAVKKPVEARGINDKYADRARECRMKHGGDCKGFACRRLTLTGYCRKWGLYVAERRQVEATAAAF